MPSRAFLLRRGFVATLLAAMAHVALAQAPSEPVPPPPGSIYTLHVYANLIQMPTLVLGPLNKAMSGLSREQFKLSIDGGPAFHPTQMHKEDAESLMLGVVLDASGSEPQLMAAAPPAIASLAGHALSTRDKLALFAFSCDYVSRPRSVPVHASDLAAATSEVLTAPTLQGDAGPGNRKHDCLRTSQLRDAALASAAAISRIPGQRAIILVTDGFDRRSEKTWRQLEEFASSYSVAIFAIRSGTYVAPPFEAPDRRESVSALRAMCETTGGFVLEALPGDLPATLARIVDLLRSRYILEFPRPSNTTAGLHNVTVRVAARDAIVLHTGATALLPNDEELNDPNTLKSDPGKAPVQGNEKIHSR